MSVKRSKRRKDQSASKFGAVIEGLSPRVIAIIVSLAVAAGICGGLLAHFGVAEIGHMILIIAPVVGAIGGFVACDLYYRQCIREEIESYGGEIRHISWQPFQGLFFGRGWRRRRRCRFYQVSYVDREGKKQSGLCAINLWGSRWDDDI